MSKIGCFNIRNQAKSPNAEIDIFGEIGESWWNEEPDNTLKRVLEEIRNIGDSKHIIVNIDSFGGDLLEGFSIYSALKEHKGGVTVKYLGASASSATIIGMAGTKRIIAKPLLLLIHNCSWALKGTKEQMKKAFDEMTMLDEQIKDVYVDNSNLSKEKVSAIMEEDRWMSATEALEHGLVTEIVDFKETSIKNYSLLSKRLENIKNTPNLPTNYKQDLPKHENNSNSNTNHKKSNPMTENDKKSFFGEIKDFLSGAMKEAKEAEIKAIADKKETERIQKITDEHQEFKTQLETLKAENEALKAEKAEFEAKLKESQKEEKKEVDEKAEKIQALEMKLAEDQKALNELKGEIAENATADPEVEQDVVDKKSVEDAKYAEEVKFLNHLKTLK